MFQIFSLQKPTPVNSNEILTPSSFSMNENQEETKKVFKGNVNADYQSDEVNRNSKELKKSANEKAVTKLNSSEARKRNLQKLVLEKKLFWETVFKNDTVSSSSQETESDRKCSSLKISSCKLSHVDSLYLQRRKPVSKSLNDIRNSDKRKRMQLYRSLDDNLNFCCKIRLEDRAKLYLDNARFISGELEQELAIISDNRGKNIFIVSS